MYWMIEGVELLRGDRGLTVEVNSMDHDYVKPMFRLEPEALRELMQATGRMPGTMLMC